LNVKVVRRLRKGSQTISFALFMFLFIQAVYLGQSSLASDLYYRLDPLIAAAAMIAGRTFIAGLLYSLINLLTAVIFGRVWCGWFCPMGTMLDWFSPSESYQKKKVSEKWRTVKYLLFVVLIFGAVVGNQTLVIADPISILTRTMTTALWPGLRFMVLGVESFLYEFDSLWSALDVLNTNIILPLFQGIESVFIASLPGAGIYAHWVVCWVCFLDLQFSAEKLAMHAQAVKFARRTVPQALLTKGINMPAIHQSAFTAMTALQIARFKRFHFWAIFPSWNQPNDRRMIQRAGRCFGQ